MIILSNEVDDIDNELSTLILNTYTKTEIQANYFDKNQVFANATSHHYDKATMDSMIPDVSIFLYPSRNPNKVF